MNTDALSSREYLPRVIDNELAAVLEYVGAVVLEGARATGKTMTALNASSSHVLLDTPSAQLLAATVPEALLDGAKPRLLDEWQTVPALWNLVRRAVDQSPTRGQFILTGSAVPSDDLTRHTGAGRFQRLRMRTMTWYEKASGLCPTDNSAADQQTQVSLSGLFAGDRPAGRLDGAPALRDVIESLLRPGFPDLLDLPASRAARRLRAYADDVARTDVHRIAELRHEPGVIKQLLAALARNTASEVTFSTLAKDVRIAAPGISAETVASYVELLQRLFVVELQRAWTPSLRSRATVRTSPRYHLVDPAFAAAVLGAGEHELMADLATTGLLFESAAVHDLTVFAGLFDGQVRHYRDSNRREIDAIITFPGGRWAAIEIKLGAAQITGAIASLNRAIADIDTESVGEPAFRLVVTGTGPVFTADDGTVTAPLSALAP